ncbi:hypothetical protein F4V43_07510 [Paenibacillus spiritus]|uniref:Uncharacterized protein n=1 Tax=Paenibacillus spiritus TaxID=2496557 RepID=A0A5J5GCL1_9BACL|nr:hypothetical protein [Paenibacillus spiritus]KAA9005909.1 hypothetical protein F4V43_07510 [Paenibacillus spiritus]
MSTSQKSSKKRTKKKAPNHSKASSKVQTESTLDFDFSSLRPVRSKQGSYRSTEPSMLTIVNTKKNGKRIVLAPEIVETIGSPSEVEIFLNDSGLVITEALFSGDNTFQLRTSANRYVIYAAELVQEVTEIFNLDFYNTTSLSFRTVQYINREDDTVAFVDLTTQG